MYLKFCGDTVWIPVCLQAKGCVWITNIYCPPSEGWGKVIVSVCSHFGGVPGLGLGGGVPGPGPGGGYLVSGPGGVPSLRLGGYPVSGPGGTGLSKGKNFWHQIWLDTCSDRKKKFLSRDIFDTRFGLIHVQTGKKNFCRGGTPPPPLKEKIFDTRFGLIHVQTGKKNFCRGTPPLPPSKGKNFWHQIWLDTCSDWEKKFLSRDPPPPRIARNCYGYTAGGMPLAFT